MKKQRIAAWIFAALFVLSVAFSLFFIAENAEHNCAGTDCAVCSVLHVAEEVSGNAKSAVVGFVFTLFLVALFAAKSAKPLFVSAVTPVSLSDISIN